MSNQYSLEDNQELIRFRGVWEQVMRRLVEQFPTNVVERFLAPLKPDSLSDGVATVVAPGSFVYEWVRDRLVEKIQKILCEELGENVKLELRMEPRERPHHADSASTSAYAVVNTIPDRPTFKPNDKYRFENFVVGQSNRLAVAGARAVALEPGKKYNPLFIYGPSGLGKTHILHSIAHRILQRDPKIAIEYISAQQFAEEFIHALQNQRVDQFRRAHRNTNVLLLDDIQFLAGKDKTQEEVFHTFNALYGLGKQIVLCSDRPPRDLFLMDERLRSRLESGLVADIQMPDTETRCAIILSKAKQDNLEISQDVAMYLAEHVPGNVRILEGALTKLFAEASLANVSPSIDFAEQIIDRHYRSLCMAKPGFDSILDVVGKHYKIPVDDIRGISRKAPIAHARHVAVYITREITGDSWKHIGGLFGDRDHTSMMHAYQKISQLMSTDRDLNSVVKQLIRNLFPNG